MSTPKSRKTPIERLVEPELELYSSYRVRMVELSSETRLRLNALFRGQNRDEAEQLLTKECADNLPLMTKQNVRSLERIRIAALKLSDGRIDKLREAVELAKVDWRDLLLAAGFRFDVVGHLLWMPHPKSD
jgi:LPS O-antigen subunit length determinant protein (WzzB/FepE family)